MLLLKHPLPFDFVQDKSLNSPGGLERVPK